MSFIKDHLIEKIKSNISRKQDSINFNGFFYFDEPVKKVRKSTLGNKTTYINRINREKPYETEEIIPSSWTLPGTVLMDIFFKIKNDEFYFYKKVDGKDYKIRFKRNGNSKPI